MPCNGVAKIASICIGICTNSPVLFRPSTHQSFHFAGRIHSTIPELIWSWRTYEQKELQSQQQIVGCKFDDGKHSLVGVELDLTEDSTTRDRSSFSWPEALQPSKTSKGRRKNTRATLDRSLSLELRRSQKKLKQAS